MANVIDILVTARDNASRTLEKIENTAERAFRRAEKSVGRIQQSFTTFNKRLSQTGDVMRRNGEGMIDAGENLSQALALPFLLIGALAVTSAAKTKEGAANIAKLKEGFKQIQTALAPIGNVILKIAVEYMPKVITVTQKVSNAFQRLSPAMQKVVIGLGALAIAIGPFLMFVGALSLSIGGLIPVFTSIGTAIAGSLLQCGAGSQVLPH
jgi:phage-related minor tail protein